MGTGLVNALEAMSAENIALGLDKINGRTAGAQLLQIVQR
jgi:hypothetical protein